MEEKLKVIFERVVPDKDFSTVTRELRLIEDLGFDSLALMMMAMEIESGFGFRFTEFVKFETVGDVCNYVAEKVTK